MALKSSRCKLKKSLVSSVLVHFGVLVILLGFIYWPNSKSVKVNLEVITKDLATAKVVSEKAIEEIKPKPLPKEEKIKTKAVFGVQPDSLQDTSSAAADTVSVKAGNTVAKENDDLKLDPNDAKSLPIPADEFLITEMPKAKKEIRIPYPESARAKNMQGPVVMELLIDVSGKIAQVKLISGPGIELNEAAVRAAANLEFTPAKIKQEPVPVKIRYTYRFQLEN